MSRAYEMFVTIEKFDAAKRDAIVIAAHEEWPFEDMGQFGDPKEYISGTGQGSLCGGETEEEFAARITKAIFSANGKPCKVSVTATNLEDLPFNVYEFDEKKLPK